MHDDTHPENLTHPEQREPGDRKPRSGGAPGPKTDPPVLTGGLKLTESLILSPQGVSVDYLKVTVPPTTAEVLTHHTEFSEPGHPQTGFASTERRLCLGGECWRQMEPLSPSKAYGTDYEHWVFPGVAARNAVERIAGLPCRPRRVDVAFDYVVDPELYPRHIEPLILEHTQKRGISIDYAGDRLKYSLYVGSKDSARYIIVYRRDLKHPELEAPILRVELRLTDVRAEQWNAQRLRNQNNGYALAAEHVREMIGIAPQDDLENIDPCATVEDEAQAAQLLFQFVHQNAVMLRACDAAGINLATLASAKFERPSKVHTTRIAKRADVLAQVPSDYLEDLVADRLRRGHA